MKYDFNEIVDRKGTDALKVEALLPRWGREDLLPMWVADMDFKAPPFVVESVKKRLENGIFGYTSIPKEWYNSIINWHDKRNQWNINEYMITFLSGVVPGLSVAVQCFTNPGDKVLIMPPVYYPFRLAVENNGRELVNSPLELIDGEYHINFEKFEQDIKGCKLFLFCNPHNPGGKVWTKDELIKIAKICKENGTLVISDEIHSDLTFAPHKHHVFSNTCPEAKENNITLNAPSKAFNLAGYCSAYAVTENTELRKQLNKFLEEKMLGDPNVFAYITTISAYRNGEEWLEEVKDYIFKNIQYFEEYIKKHTPKIKAIIPQASYLVFLDCRELNLTQPELVDFFVDKAHLALNDGASYGESGKGFMRINLATPRKIVEQALQQIKEAYNQQGF